MVSASAKQYFGLIISFDLLTVQGEDGCPHTSWRVEEVAELSKAGSIESQSILDNVIVELDLNEEGSSVGDPSPRNSPRHSTMPSTQTQHKESTNDCITGTPMSITSVLVNEFLNANKYTGQARSSLVPSLVSGEAKSDGSQEVNNSSSTSSVLTTCPTCGLPPTQKTRSKSSKTGLSFSEMSRLFPCHISFDRSLRITQIGPRLKRFLPGVRVGGRMDQHFVLTTSPWTWEKKWADFMAILSSKVQFSLDSVEKPSRAGLALSLNGPISFSDDGEYATFLSAPNVKNFSEMYDFGISMSDLSLYGGRLELVLQEDRLHNATETAERLRHLTEEVQSEQRKSLLLMQEVADRAQEALAIKKTFVRYVSHEIRTPLTVAKLGLMLVEKELSTLHNSISAESISNIQSCQQSIDIAVDILNDLLSYEKLESGIYELFKCFVPAVPFLRNTVATFSIQVKRYDTKNISYLFSQYYTWGL
jgi:hypothetical protein